MYKGVFISRTCFPDVKAMIVFGSLLSTLSFPVYSDDVQKRRLGFFLFRFN